MDITLSPPYFIPFLRSLRINYNKCPFQWCACNLNDASWCHPNITKLTLPALSPPLSQTTLFERRRELQRQPQIELIAYTVRCSRCATYAICRHNYYTSSRRPVVSFTVKYCVSLVVLWCIVGSRMYNVYMVLCSYTMSSSCGVVFIPVSLRTVQLWTEISCKIKAGVRLKKPSFGVLTSSEHTKL
jgi:hypothetical protein